MGKQEPFSYRNMTMGESLVTVYVIKELHPLNEKQFFS